MDSQADHADPRVSVTAAWFTSNGFEDRETVLIDVLIDGANATAWAQKSTLRYPDEYAYG